MFEKLLVNIKKAYSVVLFEQDFRNSILFLATYLQQEGNTSCYIIILSLLWPN